MKSHSKALHSQLVQIPTYTVSFKSRFLVSFPLPRQTAQPQHPQLIEVKELDHQHSTNTQNRA